MSDSVQFRQILDFYGFLAFAVAFIMCALLLLSTFRSRRCHGCDPCVCSFDRPDFILLDLDFGILIVSCYSHQLSPRIYHVY
jgi:hypothetical protein